MSTTTIRAPLVPAARLARPRLDRRGLEDALRSRIEGEVRFDDASRALYAQDASNYRRIPLGVVIPSSIEDVVRTVEACRSFGAPIVARGGGTALAGQTVNEAVVLDFSKRMNRILSFDPARRRARVELGVVCDALVDRANRAGLTFGPKPATHSRCCFGGMLSNNCGGMQAQMNGTAVNNVESLDVLLYDGTRLHAGWMTDDDLDAAARGPAGAVYRKLRSLRNRYADRIRAGYPDIPRRVSGYNLDQLLPGDDGRFNLARVLVGSEGTLVTMLEAELVLIEDPPVHGVVVLGYRDVNEAADAVPALLRYRPIVLEGMDDVLHDLIRKKGGEHAKHLALLSEGKGWLLVAVGGQTEDEVRETCEAIVEREAVVGSRIYMDRTQQKLLWDAREGALGATAFIPGAPDTWPGWEDSAVAPDRLGDYLRDLRALYDAYDYHPSLYGHFGMGLVHCRVPFDLDDAAGIAKFRRFMSDAADLVSSYGGSLSGEHGDGQARAELLVKMFGPELVSAMRELKAIFDPEGKMNPGKIVDPYPITDHLRLGPSYRPAHPPTHFRYPEDHGSFARATLRCVGVGKCRREHSEGGGDHDTMCPSYMVTREEKHSTRGRAHLLWEMLRGDGPIQDGFRDEGVKEALDLCLACKGCKGDCPLNVDVATHKAEFLSHYYEGRLRPRHAYAFGLIDVWARLGSLAPGLANLVTQLPGLRAIAKLAAGVAQDARIPPLSPRTFRSLFAEREPRVTSDRKVVLWVDTFSDHFHPDTAMAAVEVLEAVGWEVVVPRERVCCGRPLYDFGMLDRARGHLEDVLRVMKPHIDAERPVVVLEPSCASVLVDELHEMMPERRDGDVLRRRTMLLGDFLVKEAGSVPEVPRRKAIVQGHCHHKSVLDWESATEALRRTGLDVEVLESGCCGMAGAFGLVQSTRDVGVASGERVLLPRVRSADETTLVVADGFSCREQIAQHTDRRALHLAEVLKLGLDGGLRGAGRPEAAIAVTRERAVRRSMLRAAAAVAIGGLAVWLVARRRSRR